MFEVVAPSTTVDPYLILYKLTFKFFFSSAFPLERASIKFALKFSISLRSELGGVLRVTLKETLFFDSQITPFFVNLSLQVRQEVVSPKH